MVAFWIRCCCFECGHCDLAIWTEVVRCEGSAVAVWVLRGGL